VTATVPENRRASEKTPRVLAPDTRFPGVIDVRPRRAVLKYRCEIRSTGSTKIRAPIHDSRRAGRDIDLEGDSVRDEVEKGFVVGHCAFLAVFVGDVARLGPRCHCTVEPNRVGVAGSVI
jgi:hypothetical protein